MNSGVNLATENFEKIPRLNEVNLPKIRVPSVDLYPGESMDLARGDSVIVHIGPGSFFSSHLAYNLQQCRTGENQSWWSYHALGIRAEDEKKLSLLAEQDHLYTVISDQTPEIVPSVRASTLAYNDREKALSVLNDPKTKIVSLTITEKGYEIAPLTAAHDTSRIDAFELITEALYRRMLHKEPGFTVMSCDNIQGNGDKAQEIITQCASRYEARFTRWLERNVLFPNTVVDCITPAPSPELVKFLAENHKYIDRVPVRSENWRQFIIEDKFLQGRPAFTSRSKFPNLDIRLTGDVTAFERLKIRVLNASHTALCYFGALEGIERFDNLIAKKHFKDLMTQYVTREVIPTLGPVPNQNPLDYLKTVQLRFSNPIIADTVSRICEAGSVKMKRFIQPTLEDQLEDGGDITLTALAIAGWIHSLRSRNTLNAPIIVCDPMAQELQEKAASLGFDPTPILGMEEIFGRVGLHPKLIENVSNHLRALSTKGVVGCIESVLSDLQPTADEIFAAYEEECRKNEPRDL